MDQAVLHSRVRTRGVNLLVYWIFRAICLTFFLTYLRMRRSGREHIPLHGPAIIASNHRSFLDPFVIGTLARRPLYYMAKREIFGYGRVASWLLSALGAFPVNRGRGDQETIQTVKELLARGEVVLIFPEGHRIRPGGLGSPRRGVGRLAIETGVPVVPVAVIGTDKVRRGWVLRPRKVACRAGAPMRFPMLAKASPELAATVTARIWQSVMLQWEWLGGEAAGDPVDRESGAVDREPPAVRSSGGNGHADLEGATGSGIQRSVSGASS